MDINTSIIAKMEKVSNKLTCLNSPLDDEKEPPYVANIFRVDTSSFSKEHPGIHPVTLSSLSIKDGSVSSGDAWRYYQGDQFFKECLTEGIDALYLALSMQSMDSLKKKEEHSVEGINITPHLAYLILGLEDIIKDISDESFYGTITENFHAENREAIIIHYDNAYGVISTQALVMMGNDF